MTIDPIDRVLEALGRTGVLGTNGSEAAEAAIRDQLRAQVLRDSLREFVPQAWPLFDKAPFKSNWHLDVVCEHLQAVADGEIKRLIINVPPRTAKSSVVSVAWPAWSWLRRPELQWLCASYAERLSTRDSVKCRRLIQSRGGRREGGTLIERVGYRGLMMLLGADWKLTGDQNVKTRFENTQTGYRLATSVGGTATGEGGDVILIDDPHKADEVESEIQRENVTDWMDGTMSTRLNDPETGAVVVIMQRLHEVDLTGHLLEQGDYTHVCLPMRYEPSHPFVWPKDRRTEPGELLWPGHFPERAVARLEKQLGSYRAAGQLQQRPAPAEGGILKTAWWRFYPPEWLAQFSPEAMGGNTQWPGPRLDRVWASWDTALKAKSENDYTVGQLWGQAGPDCYLLRQVRGRWGLDEIITQALELNRWGTERLPGLTGRIYIENTANGPEVIAALRKKVPGVIPVKADADKLTRAHAVTPKLEAGNVWVPGDRIVTEDGKGARPGPSTPSWAQELIAECASFPKGAHDDQVDALSQALDPRHTWDNAGARVGARRDVDRVLPSDRGESWAPGVARTRVPRGWKDPPTLSMLARRRRNRWGGPGNV